jgi:hypothetical protein
MAAMVVVLVLAVRLERRLPTIILAHLAYFPLLLGKRVALLALPQRHFYLVVAQGPLQLQVAEQM